MAFCWLPVCHKGWFLTLFAAFCGVFGLGCVFVSTLITRDIETFFRHAVFPVKTGLLSIER
jgi:hypothetical protein